MKMIERMARSAFLNAWVRGGQMRREGEARWDDPARRDELWRVHWIADTRVAVEAMRDSSQGMRIAGHAALTESDACAPDLGHQIGFGALGDAWRAMIDDVLAEQLSKPATA